jgi:hypothetical protein
MESRRRRESIGLGKRDFVSGVEVHSSMNLLVLADYNPAIGGGFPVRRCHRTPSNVR